MTQPVGAPPFTPALPDAIEIASGDITGIESALGPLPQVRKPVDLRSILADAVLPALQRPPCVVSFSGGRDSSAVLAVAVDAARRHGLPLPIPVTLRFPQVAETHEAHWQELVARHLDLTDWERLTFDDELDVIGPYAETSLRRHGVLAPANAYVHLPILELASGGSLLTGAGGDELLLWSRERIRVSMLLAGRALPRHTDIATAMQVLAPAPIRRKLYRRDALRDGRPPWLRSAAWQEVVRRAADTVAQCSPRFARWVHDAWWRSRYRMLVESAFASLAHITDVVVIHPLQSAPVLSALTAHAGPGGFWTRTAAMRTMVGHLLPEPVLSRHTKADFSDAFWTSRSRAFVAAWDGSGVDHDIVNAVALSRMWTAPGTPTARTHMLLQSAWLNSLPARTRATR